MRENKSKYLLNSVDETKILRAYCKREKIPCYSNNDRQWVRVDTIYAEKLDHYIDRDMRFR
jgi:hypothetical protein